MSHPRSRLVAATSLLLALLVAMPLAAAAASRVAIVNGIPGKTVDVCVGNKEIRSRLAYGKATVKNMGNGAKVLRLRRASPGACQGKQLAKRTLIVENGADLTVVGTRFAPNKVLLFDNATIPIGPSATAVMRHAADIGVAGFKYAVAEDGQPWFDVALDHPWQKGNWGWGNRAPGQGMLWWAHQPPFQRVIAGPYELIPEAATRHESILVGTNLGNLRFARFKVTDPG